MSEKGSGGVRQAGKHRLNETEETVKNKIIISYNEPTPFWFLLQ